MTAAIFGLLGVLLGGLLTGVVNLGLEKRRERGAARASSRLLEEELEPIAGALYRLRAGLLSSQEDEVRHAVERLESFSFTAWERERPLLAGAFPAADWYSVVTAHAGLARLVENLREHPEEPAESVRQRLHAEDVQRLESETRQALGTLGRWGGNEPPSKQVLQGPRWGG